MPDLHVTFAGTDLICDTARRRITGVAVPYGVTIRHGWYDRLQFQPGSIRWKDPSRVKLLVDHDQTQPVGYATAIRDTPDGLQVSFTVPEGMAGDQALADAARGLRDGLSVGVALDGEPDRDSGLATGHLREVSLCAIPAFDSARVTDVAATATPTTREETTVPDVIEATDIAPVDLTPIHDQFATVKDELTELRGLIGPAATAPRHPLAQFSGMGSYLEAAFTGAEPRDDLLALAIADEVTGDIPGLLPPNWQSVVHGVFDLGRRAINAFGIESAGATGMTVNWPYEDPAQADTVGKQTTQKTEVTSVKYLVKLGAANLETYAGALDISYQALFRSSPNVMDFYLRRAARDFNKATDAAFCAALVTAATAQDGYDIAADTDGAKFAAELFKASVAVEGATGLPAEFAIVASDVFLKLSAMTKLVAPKYNTVNVPGVAQANTLQIDVNGLPVIHDRNLATGNILVSNSSAASWLEDGPRVATAETPTKLGRDVALWGLGAPAVYLPAGVIKVVHTAP